MLAQLDGVAKKNGFASYDEYNNVVDNISLVLAGFDPATKKYVGAEAVIKAQIAQVQADKKMPAKDKKEALADLNEALKSPPPAIENKGNIDLVAKYYDKLAEALGRGRAVDVDPADHEKAPEKSPGLFRLSCSPSSARANAQARVRIRIMKLSKLSSATCIHASEFVAEGRQAGVHLAEMRVGLRQVRIDLVGGLVAGSPALPAGTASGSRRPRSAASAPAD